MSLLSFCRLSVCLHNREKLNVRREGRLLAPNLLQAVGGTIDNAEKEELLQKEAILNAPLSLLIPSRRDG